MGGGRGPAQTFCTGVTTAALSAVASGVLPAPYLSSAGGEREGQRVGLWSQVLRSDMAFHCSLLLPCTLLTRHASGWQQQARVAGQHLWLTAPQPAHCAPALPAHLAHCTHLAHCLLALDPPCPARPPLLDSPMRMASHFLAGLAQDRSCWMHLSRMDLKAGVVNTSDALQGQSRAGLYEAGGSTLT